MKSTLFGPHPVEGEDWAQIREDKVRPWYWVHKDGRVWRKPIQVDRSHCVYTEPAKLMQSTVQSYGYPQIGLRTKQGVESDQRAFMVHRLVMLYHGPEKPFDEAVVNHIDGDKTNYSLDNLEWVTHQENLLHGALQKTVDRLGEKPTMQKVKKWLHHFD